MKNINKEHILNFNQLDWSNEISSGFDGYRNINPKSVEHDIWIYENEFLNRQTIKNCYERDYKLLSDFRSDCLPFGEYPEFIIQEFLNKKYFN